MPMPKDPIKRELWRQRQSEAHKRNPTKYWLGKNLSEETKRKLSIALKGQIPWNKGKTKEDYPQMSNSGVKKGNIPWITGKHHTQKSKDKMNESHKGQVAWNKNIPCSEKTKEKLRKTLKGRIAWNKGKTKKDFPRLSNSGVKKGNIPWSKGKTALIDKRILSKEKHPNWKNGITLLTGRIRNSLKYRLWHSDVFTRDYFTCQECGKRSGYLEAHHRESFADIMEINDITTFEQAMDCEELWNINNGITYCKKCHNFIRQKIKEMI